MLFKDIYRKVKFFIQRGMRGYSDQDMWNADMYISGQIANTLEWFINNSVSVPMRFAEGLDPYAPDTDIMEARRKEEYEKYIPIFRRYGKEGLAFNKDWQDKFGGVTNEEIQEALAWFNDHLPDLWD